jgi:hypothetical protein
MNFVQKLAVSLTGLFAFSTVLCGCSIAQKATFEQSRLNFHMGLAVLTILASFGTIALLVRATKKQ